MEKVESVMWYECFLLSFHPAGWTRCSAMPSAKTTSWSELTPSTVSTWPAPSWSGATCRFRISAGTSRGQSSPPTSPLTPKQALSSSSPRGPTDDLGVPIMPPFNTCRTDSWLVHWAAASPLLSFHRFDFRRNPNTGWCQRACFSVCGGKGKEEWAAHRNVQCGVACFLCARLYPKDVLARLLSGSEWPQVSSSVFGVNPASCHMAAEMNSSPEHDREGIKNRLVGEKEETTSTGPPQTDVWHLSGWSEYKLINFKDNTSKPFRFTSYHAAFTAPQKLAMQSCKNWFLKKRGGV